MDICANRRHGCWCMQYETFYYLVMFKKYFCNFAGYTHMNLRI